MLKKYSFVLLSFFLLTFPTIPTSFAETGYRYWGYFQAPAGSSSWNAAMTGPTVKVKDGDVEGWVFTASSNDIPAATPMMEPDFAGLCGEVSQVSGKIRVGLVVDFGAGEIAPSGETPKEFFSDCVVVPEGSVGLDVLSAALDLRAGDSGLICGIAGYPAEECGAEIDMALLQSVQAEPISAQEEIESETSQTSNALPLGALAVIALLVGVIAIRRRNRK